VSPKNSSYFYSAPHMLSIDAFLHRSITTYTGEGGISSSSLVQCIKCTGTYVPLELSPFSTRGVGLQCWSSTYPLTRGRRCPSPSPSCSRSPCSSCSWPRSSRPPRSLSRCWGRWVSSCLTSIRTSSCPR
jgi:hypothetical protein